jgi:hypothetical protein
LALRSDSLNSLLDLKQSISPEHLSWVLFHNGRSRKALTKIKFCKII